MDAQRLKQYRALQREIRQLERQIDKMPLQSSSSRLEVDRVTGSSPEHPYTPVSYTISGYAAEGQAKRRKLKEKREKFKAALEEEALEVETWVQGIEDSLTREILRMRYIDGLSLQEVASEIGYSNRQVIRKILAVINSSPHVTK